MSDITLTSGQESSLTLFLSLVTGRLKPGKLWYDREYRLKYLFRSLACPRQTLKLTDAIIHEPVMREILAVQHTLPSKIHRPYLYGGMPVADRAGRLSRTTDLPETCLTLSFVRRCSANKGGAAAFCRQRW